MRGHNETNATDKLPCRTINRTRFSYNSPLPGTCENTSPPHPHFGRAPLTSLIRRANNSTVCAGRSSTNANWPRRIHHGGLLPDVW